jgi:polyhydroxyalkanoate synthesis regulator protein
MKIFKKYPNRRLYDMQQDCYVNNPWIKQWNDLFSSKPNSSVWTRQDATSNYSTEAGEASGTSKT